MPQGMTDILVRGDWLLALVTLAHIVRGDAFQRHVIIIMVKWLDAEPIGSVRVDECPVDGELDL
jgi:hypothetical protein